MEHVRFRSVIRGTNSSYSPFQPEVRKAAREQAIRAAKEKQRVAKAKKPAPAPAAKKAQTSQKASKPQQKAAPRVGGKR